MISIDENLEASSTVGVGLRGAAILVTQNNNLQNNNLNKLLLNNKIVYKLLLFLKF